MRPATPRGFRDVLPHEAAEREVLATAMSEAISAWGYGPVETPVVEEYATLEAGMGSSLEGTAFRLFDSDGRLLALRPEMTVPIARLIATRLVQEPGAQRLRYTAQVYREHASLRGQARQFTQVGVELVGEGGPAADAEVVAILVEALRASGLADFKVAIGTVAVLRALLESTGMPESWQQQVLDSAHERNLVEIDRLTVLDGLSSELAAAISGVPRLRGSDAVDDCRELIEACGCTGVLDGFEETLDLIASAGVAGAVSVDFGVVRSFDYYTGMVLEVDAPGLGVAVGGGGRYDGVLRALGSDAPAAGFAIGLERLRIALSEQGLDVATPDIDAVLGGEDAAEIFRAAGRLRAAGWSTRLDTVADGAMLVSEADRLGATEALSARDGRIVRLDRSGRPSLPLDEPLPAPLAREGGEVR
ncbi:MAG: ATP phosphoribosyltransferase regulatory subunit [Actinomycetota bacterium]|nr:ATP phosphoribosyltransferase regulatory subunit [Actinomycetota bacterium]